ncbi:MAG: RdgB/HAM1 family non-canonical purine NTP pyrophosphatase [Phycisphaerales bacterium]|nr:RdgB/HAM1 family non-canonical purine NTP pyrophosphatase [Phycisphaerales bacterium]
MKQKQKLLIATGNAGKIREIEHELDHAGILNDFQLLGLKDLPPPPHTPDCIEDRPSFVGNATKKARHFAAVGNCLTLADDSGLCADALNGAPGVYSARYAGLTGPREIVDQANNAKLLKELENTPDDQRQARFVCAAALALPTVDLVVIVDEVCGTLLRSPRGTNGFGYDPLFYLPQFHKTTAELSMQEKSQISHRGKALRRLIAWLRENRP